MSQVQFYLQLAMFLTARTVLNTGFRIVYPFLPVLSRGLGVTPEAITLGITLRSFLGLFSPIIGSLADGWGRKRSMLTGMLIFCAGMLLVYLSPTYPALIAALLMTTLSKIIFDPAVYAYLGDRVDYKRRGLAVGITEFGWSGAFLVGIPIVGFLIERLGWKAPFPFLALVAVGIFVLLWKQLPNDDRAVIRRSTNLGKGFQVILRDYSAIAALVIGFLITCSNEIINVVFGTWMENAFAMRVAALGLASAVIGIAELAGEGVVAGFVDRLGKRKSVGVGLVLYCIGCLLLPLMGFSEIGALFGLFVFFLTFEFTLVSTLPLMTELVPEARATLMATTAASHSLGRMIGSLIGPILFSSGLGANAVAGVIMNIVALGLLIWFVRERLDRSTV